MLAYLLHSPPQHMPGRIPSTWGPVCAVLPATAVVESHGRKLHVTISRLCFPCLTLKLWLRHFSIITFCNAVARSCCVVTPNKPCRFMVHASKRSTPVAQERRMVDLARPLGVSVPAESALWLSFSRVGEIAQPDAAGTDSRLT